MSFEPQQHCIRGHAAYAGDFTVGRNVCQPCLAKDRADRGRGDEYLSLRSRRRAKLLLRSCAVRARQKGVAFDLDEALIQTKLDAGVCERTGIAFDMEGKRTWNAPSIDRVRPADGYVSSNVRVILFGLNAALGDWGEDALRKIVDAL